MRLQVARPSEHPAITELPLRILADAPAERRQLDDIDEDEHLTEDLNKILDRSNDSAI